MSSRRFIAAVSALCFVVLGVPFTRPAWADTQALLSDYRITSWIGGDEVTLGEVRGIVQDQVGYLWLASEVGLVRFDGTRFTSSNLVAGSIQLPKVPSRAVYIARDSSLWVGYGKEHGLYRIANGRVHSVHLTGEITGLVHVIAEDRGGALWVGDDGGLHRLRDGRWEHVTVWSPAMRNRRVSDVLEDRRGRIWVASAAGLYSRIGDEPFQLAAFGEGIHRALEEDASGQVWTTDDRAGYRPVDGPSPGLFEARGMNVLHDRRGNTWVTTIGQGLWQVASAAPGQQPLVSRSSARSGLANDEMSAMLEDREGNIWVASIRGLTRLTPYKARPITDIGVVRALSVDREGLAWAATSTGLRLLTADGRGVPESRLLSRQPIRSVHVAKSGSVWAATAAGLHPVRNRRLAPALASTRDLTHITAIASARDGSLWLCDDERGVFQLVHDQRREVLTGEGPEPKATFVYVDAADRPWVALDNGVVLRLDADGTQRRFGPKEGLPHSRVTVIHHDRWGDIWVGGNQGLSLIRDDRVDTLSLKHLVGSWSVSSVLDDDRGDLWIAVSFFGLIRANREDVLRSLSLDDLGRRFHVYEMSGGMGHPDVALGGSGGRGRHLGSALWFATSAGATMVDPARLVASDHEPGLPIIENVVADGQRYDPTGPVEIPGGTSRLQLDFSQVDVSSSASLTRFRYRLDGFDRDWVDGASTRVASYTNLSPGLYRFRLQASERGAGWGDTETRLAFQVEPMFYQTRFFYGLSALGLFVAGVTAWQVRLRAVRREVALRFSERVRLSREIHDTLLQSLVGLSLQIDSAGRDLDRRPSRTREQLLAMRQQVEGYIRETRQSIWDLRSAQLDREGLVGSLQSIGERLTAEKVPFSLTVTGTPRQCPPKVETSAVRVGHEALTNAVRHAGARHVLVELGFLESALRLRVQDDGRGFDPADMPSDGSTGHYGILGMRERVQDLGGTFTIESRPGLGAQIVAEFPLPPRA
ncbi:MAG: two-component regulator propeller domain-containing protein [Vicinamibacterales bacterium]